MAHWLRLAWFEECLSWYYQYKYSLWGNSSWGKDVSGGSMDEWAWRPLAKQGWMSLLI